MKKYFAVLATILLILTQVRFSYAKDGAGASQVGIQYWPTNISSDRSSGEATFWGPLISLQLIDNAWIKGSLLRGEEKYSSSTTDVTSVDLILGRSISQFDLGIGYRYWRNNYSTRGSSRESGPLVYTGFMQPLGETHLSIYGNASWNFVDFGDPANHEHYIIEGGLSYSLKIFTITTGYRHKNYYNNRGFKYNGIVVSASYNF
jgi:hypothetical protein